MTTMKEIHAQYDAAVNKDKYDPYYLRLCVMPPEDQNNILAFIDAVLNATTGLRALAALELVFKLGTFLNKLEAGK